MTKRYGINCIYRAPLASKEFDDHGDLDSRYYPPETVACIFQEHPDQKTMKKMGWIAELQESSSIIHVPYDLPHLEVGALFEVPSAIEGAKNRMFRVISMQMTMIYPASIACEIAPEYADTVEIRELHDFRNDTNTILMDNEEDD